MPTKRQRLREMSFERHGKKCYYCGKWATGRAMHIDHVVPRGQCGANVDNIDNLVPACRACNMRKGNRPLDAYIKSRLRQLRTERDILVARYREHFPQNE